MQEPPLGYRHIRFPGRAGQFQAQGSTAALVAELGDRYELYHDFLARELAKFSRRPRANDYPDDRSYYEASAHVQEIAQAEAQLRAFRNFRRGRSQLSLAGDVSSPVIGSDDSLLAG